MKGSAQKEIPKSTALLGNYPNPANPKTEIRFHLPAFNGFQGQAGISDFGLVKLVVFDLLGREVATLVDGIMEPGDHRVTFDASNLGSGVYFYRLTTNNFSDVKKLVVLR
jgi:hypothetical protein